jgi:hypothetical protein
MNEENRPRREELCDLDLEMVAGGKDWGNIFEALTGTNRAATDLLKEGGVPPKPTPTPNRRSGASTRSRSSSARITYNEKAPRRK